MKKLQFLNAVILLLSLADAEMVYLHSVKYVVFLSAAYVLVEEIEIKNDGWRYLLLVIMLFFNPFFELGASSEQARLFITLLSSVFLLFKTSGISLDLHRIDKMMKEAF